MFARLRVTAESLPMVTRVWSTPGMRADLARDALGLEARLGEARPLRGAHVHVELGHVVGRREALRHAPTRAGTQEPSVAHAATTTTQRCCMTHRRTAM